MTNEEATAEYAKLYALLTAARETESNCTKGWF